jgi:hypothetical protein
VKPTGQIEQDVALEAGAIEPSGQVKHAKDCAVAAVPGTQGVQLVAPVSEREAVPAGQTEHWVLPGTVL